MLAVRFLNPFLLLFWIFIVSFFFTLFDFANIYHSSLVWSSFGIPFLLVLSIVFADLLRIIVNNKYIQIDEGDFRSSFSYEFKLFILFFFISIFEFAIYGFPVLTGDYKSFGIPIVHVFAYGLALYLVSVASGFLFSGVDTTRGKAIFYIFAVVFYSVAIISRHLLIFSIIAIFLSYLSFREVSFRAWVVFALVLFFLVLLFGVLGSLRMANILGVSFSESEAYILDAGGASDSYLSLGLGPSFFWFWLYVASPVYNLFYTFQNASVYGSDNLGFSGFLLFEILPETISKRIADIFVLEPSKPILVVEHLNVATAFSGSYMYLGFFGVFLYFSFFAAIFLLFFLSKTDNLKRYLVTLVFGNVAILSIFDNMLVIPSVWICLILIIFRPKNNA